MKEDFSELATDKLREQNSEVSRKLEELDIALQQLSLVDHMVEKEFKNLDTEYGALIRSIIHNSLVQLSDKTLYLSKIFNNLGKLYLLGARFFQNPELYTDSAKFYQ